MRRVLVACEYSGTVRDAFAARGWDAWSCDLLPTEKPGNHYQGNVFDIINDGWHLMIAHPPCTHLSVSGAKWFDHPRFPNKRKQQKEAVEFAMALADADIPHICIENPVSVLSSFWRKPDQIIQPYQFGHEARKTTCLWLKNLRPLVPTKIVSQGEILPSGNPKWMNGSFTKTRWKIRSQTFDGIAEAMADQWSKPQPIQLELI